MTNILSYKPGTVLLGREIRTWIRYQISHQTSHYKEAVQMQKYLNIQDNKEYIVSKGDYQASERSFHVIRKNN